MDGSRPARASVYDPDGNCENDVITRACVYVTIAASLKVTKEECEGQDDG
jgi:hypothetical protein